MLPALLKFTPSKRKTNAPNTSSLWPKQGFSKLYKAPMGSPKSTGKATKIVSTSWSPTFSAPPLKICTSCAAKNSLLKQHSCSPTNFSNASNGFTPKTTFTETSSHKTFWSDCQRKATSSTWLILGCRKSIVIPKRISTFLTKKTRTWQELQGMRQLMRIWGLNKVAGMTWKLWDMFCCTLCKGFCHGREFGYDLC